MKMNAAALPYLTLFLLLASVAAEGVAANKSQELMSYSQVLDSSYQRRDAAALVRLAASLTGKDLWHLGREGPYDVNFLRMRALKSAESWMLDERGVLRSEIVSRLGSLSEAEQSLVQCLSVNPSDDPAMLQLLSNPDLSVRWIGLEKTRFLSRPSLPVVHAVRDIAEHDDFIVLTESAEALEFAAPLRTLANTRLITWNEQEIPEERSAIARAGLRQLLKQYSDHPDRRPIIFDRVSSLNSVFSPIARAELERLNGNTPQDRETLNEFKQASATNERRRREWQSQNASSH